MKSILLVLLIVPVAGPNTKDVISLPIGTLYDINEFKNNRWLDESFESMDDMNCGEVQCYTMLLCYNCIGRSDGNYEIGCRSYLICKDGKPVIHDCPRNQTHFMVYDNRTQQCADPSSVMHPCGVLRDCTGIKDGRFPDEDEHCRSFYTCSEGQFLGHNFCPAGLVFDSTQGTCNWKNAVAPPCGDMVVATP